MIAEAIDHVSAGYPGVTRPTPPVTGTNATGVLAHKKTHRPRTVPQAYASGPRGVLGEWAFSYGRGTPVQSNIQHSHVSNLEWSNGPDLRTITSQNCEAVPRRARI